MTVKRAYLVLSDGLVFEGKSFGAEGEAVGEVVFNTSMTGYQEILTDASYKGQMVVMTYTQMGNYGVNEEDIESTGGPKAEGFIVKEYLPYPSNWRMGASLGDYFKNHKVVGIEGIDTRGLTRHLRDRGSKMGIISTENDPKSLYKRIKDHSGIGGIDLVKEVTCKETFRWSNINGSRSSSYARAGSRDPFHVVVYDFGVKLNILRSLAGAGFEVTVVPAETPAEKVFEMKPDGIVLSNGPGDPEAVTYGIENTKKLINKKGSAAPPLFGICLGHQILGLALGGRTYKLKFGHHGGNHPVMDIETGKVEITAQNHNYCVDIESVKGHATLTHKNLYDGTEEGMKHVELPIFSVQHHPEASPGPHDSAHLFSRFREMILNNGR